MSNELNHTNKPSHPAPPLNALQKPSVKKRETVVRRSVYDEIAERRKYEKHKIGVSSYDSREQAERKFTFGDEISDIIDEVKQNKSVEPPEKQPAEPPVEAAPKVEEVVSEPEQSPVEQPDDDVKVYVPGDDEIFSKTQKLPIDEILDKSVEYTYPRDKDNFEDEDNYDVPPIPAAKKRIGIWVALISVLSALCVIAAGAYGLVNGYFDGIIKML